MTPAIDTRDLRSHLGCEATATLERDALRLDYTIANRSRHTVYLADLFVRVGPRGAELRDDMATIGFAPPSTAIVARRCERPANTIFAMPPRVYAIRVEAGARHRGALHTDLPLRLRGVHPSDDPARILTCQRVRLELPILPEAPDLDPIEEHIGDRSVHSLSAAAFDLHRTMTIEIDRLRVPFFVDR